MSSPKIKAQANTIKSRKVKNEQTKNKTIEIALQHDFCLQGRCETVHVKLFFLTFVLAYWEPLETVGTESQEKQLQKPA